MVRRKHILPLWLLCSMLLAPLWPAQAQTVLPCSAIAPSYGIDSNLVTHEEARHRWLASLPDTSYSTLSTQCALLNTKVQHMLSSLRNTYPIHDGKLWLDSLTCIADHEEYGKHLSQLSTWLLQKSAEYDQKEKSRMLAQVKAAEAAARAKAEAAQRARDDSLSHLTTTITTLHREIGHLCDGIGITDKNLLKRRKDLYYNYLSLYNKYNLTATTASSDMLRQLQQLERVQHSIIDSVLGHDSYEARIALFATQLRQRCATNHKEIVKSYTRTFRNVEVPLHFSTIAEYDRFVQQLKEVLQVQQAYLRTVELCEDIDKRSTDILLRAATHKTAQSSYKAAVEAVDRIPAFISITESQRFLAKLEEFKLVQEQYFHILDHMDKIDSRSREVLAACGKNYADLAAGYKELVADYDFSPSFTTLEGANFYDKTLDDFEVLQDTYGHLLELRRLISEQDQKILNDKSLPQDVRNGYKLIKSVTQMKPDFSTVARGELFVQSMKDFISLQEHVMAIAEKQKVIDNNLKQMKLWNKTNGGTVKAYQLMRSDMKQEFIITNEKDLTDYDKYQDRQLKLQQKFISVIQSDERIDYNRRLQGVRDPEKIRLILNL